MTQPTVSSVDIQSGLVQWHGNHLTVWSLALMQTGTGTQRF